VVKKPVERSVEKMRYVVKAHYGETGEVEEFSVKCLSKNAKTPEEIATEDVKGRRDITKVYIERDAVEGAINILRQFLR
jgi:hypothetical protein